MVELTVFNFREKHCSNKHGPAMPWNSSSIWVTWEDQRRTVELAKLFGVKLIKMIPRKYLLFKYVYLISYTLALLIRENPTVLIVQNPSLILTLLCTMYKIIFNKYLIVDRHTYFLLAVKRSLKKSLFDIISRFTLRHANLTIVTNEFLSNFVVSQGGRSFVLQDKIPDLRPTNSLTLKGKTNVVFICTFCSDEPVDEVIKAASLLPSDIIIYITGNYKKLKSVPLENLSANIVLTGFLPEERYIDLLNSCDIVLDLTKLDHCLVCGAYEAISIKKPLILSDTKALRDYFTEVPVYVQNESSKIAEGILYASNHLKELSRNTFQLHKKLIEEWNVKFSSLVRLISNDLNIQE